MKNITIDITQNDIEARKLRSSSGQTIDALAYAAGEWDSNDLWENNIDYAPREPYEFDYETDLLENTRTAEDFNMRCGSLYSPDMYINYKPETIGDLQAGAYCALNDPDAWSKLLEAWTEKLKENGTDGPSKDFNKELQDAQDSYNDDQYKEWLNGEYRGKWSGIISTISKYFTESRDAGDYDQKADIYTFTLSPDDAHELACGCYEDGCKDYTTAEDFKAWMLDQIANAGESRKAKDQTAREIRAVERAKEKAYKDARAQAEAAARRAKLEALTITDKTLGELLTDKNETITRHALGILKESKKNNN